jgi:hypothetical protein
VGARVRERESRHELERTRVRGQESE